MGNGAERVMSLMHVEYPGKRQDVPRPTMMESKRGGKRTERVPSCLLNPFRLEEIDHREYRRLMIWALADEDEGSL